LGGPKLALLKDMICWFPLDAGGVGVGVVTTDREASNEFGPGWEWCTPFIEASTLFCENDGRGYGGEAA